MRSLAPTAEIRWRLWRQASLWGGLGLSGGFMFFLLWQGTRLFGPYPLTAFLLGRHWEPGREYGSLPFLAGSLLVIAVALGAALLPGLLAAGYLAVLAPPPAAGLLRGILRAATAVPSVVWGLFGLGYLRPRLRWLAPFGFSPLTAGLTLALMILPTLIFLAEEGFRAVPRAMVEASTALGANPEATLRRLIWPASRARLATATLLTVNRALGETMAVEMLVGNSPAFPPSLTRPAATLTSQIVLEMGGSAPGSRWNDALFSLALLLLLISLAVNLVARAVAQTSQR